MDDSCQCSPVIRSSVKPASRAIPDSSVQPATVVTPVGIITGNGEDEPNTTVSPLSGFRESATVTDISWTTAFETPRRVDISNNHQTAQDVFITTCAEQSTFLPENSHSTSEEESFTQDPFLASKSVTPSNSNGQKSSLTTLQVLSNFRNTNLQKCYPKFSLPTSDVLAKKPAAFSTPKPDRPLTKLLQPPNSDIDNGKNENEVKIRSCPCGTCSCPPTFIKDSGTQTYEEDTNTNITEENDYEMGGLTSVLAEEIGRYDGFTQQSIHETAKASRKRLKAVVHFRNDAADDEINQKDSSIANDLIHYPDIIAISPVKTTLKNTETMGFLVASGKKIPKPKRNKISIFGNEDFSDLTNNLPHNIPSGFCGNELRPNPEYLGSPVLSDVRESTIQSEIPVTVKEDQVNLAKQSMVKSDAFSKAASIFGADELDTVMKEQPRDANYEGFQTGRQLTASDKQPREAAFSKAASIFGADELDTVMKEQPRDANYEGFQTGRQLTASGKQPSKNMKASPTFPNEEKGLVDPKMESAPSKCGVPSFASNRYLNPEKNKGKIVPKLVTAGYVGFVLNGSVNSAKAVSGNVDAIKKARAIFGDDEINSLLKEQPRDSNFVGFQPSKKTFSLNSNLKPDTTSEFKPSIVPEGSDVESIYDEELGTDSSDNVEAELEIEESIPAEFFQPSGQSQSLQISEISKAKSDQDRIIIEKSCNLSSPSKLRIHGIMSRTKQFAAELPSVSTLIPSFDFPLAEINSTFWAVLSNPYVPFEFPATNGSCSVHTSDEGLLVTSEDGSIGCEEIRKCLLTTPGVVPRLIPANWVENHYRWIIWKLVKEVFAFRREFLNPAERVNPERVIQQLKYRYDLEIDGSKRSCIRRIVEKDSSSKAVIVLCVSRIIYAEHQPTNHLTEDESSKDSFVPHHGSSLQIELTDGWYAMKAHVDAALQRMIQAGRIFVGCKLIIAGADLNGLDEATDPLSIPPSCHLKIYSNSTRLVKRWWSAKMGFSRFRKLNVPIKSMFPGGGCASSIKAVVVRVYPLLFVEKRIATENGVISESIYRLEHDEDVEAERAKAVQEKKIEELMQKLSKECQSPSQSPRSAPKRRKITPAEVDEMTTGEEIAAAIRESNDPESIEQILSDWQRSVLQQYMVSKSERIAKRIQDELKARSTQKDIMTRNVTPVLKVFVVGLEPRDRESKICALISIWRPCKSATELLQEGQAYQFSNVSVSRPLNSGLALLNGTQNTSWSALSKVSTDELFAERNDTLLKDIPSIIANQKLSSLTHREIDFVGIGLRISTEQAGFKRLYFVDSDGDVGVLQGTSISFHSFTSGECQRQHLPIFVASNVKINSTASNCSNIQTLYAQDYSVFISVSRMATSVPVKITNHYRHLEAAVKIALANCEQLIENGMQKLDSLSNLLPVGEDGPRTGGRSSLASCSDSGPQRPGLSISKTPAASVFGQTNKSETLKRKTERLERLCTPDANLLEISPLPIESTSSRSRSVLKRPFKTPRPQT